MEWTNEKVINLIDLYQNHPVLWDCRLKDYKDRNKRMGALLEIAITFGVEKEEIERKIKNLVCHFSRELKKEREGTKSGLRGDSVYRSKWYCYNSMLFLKNRNRPIGTVDAHARVGEKRKKTLFKSRKTPPSSHKIRKRSASGEALSMVKDIEEHNTLRDQYTAFGEQVGMRIRELSSSNAKKIVKHLISTLLFEAEMGKYDNPNYLHAYHLVQFSQSPFCSSTVPGCISSPSPLPQHPSCSTRMPATYQPQQPVTSPTLSSDDSISMEIINSR